MKRRTFLTAGTNAIVAGGLTGLATPPAHSVEVPLSTENGKVPSLLREYTEEDQRRRLNNIAACTQSIRSAVRTHLDTD